MTRSKVYFYIFKLGDIWARDLPTYAKYPQPTTDLAPLDQTHDLLYNSLIANCKCAVQAYYDI